MCFVHICRFSLFALAMTGCVYALHPSNVPLRETLKIQAPEPEHFTVQVDNDQSHQVGSDGRVSFDVPPIPSGCAVYLFGFVKVADHPSEDAPAILILRDGRVVHRLSLNQICLLPAGSENSHVLKLK